MYVKYLINIYKIIFVIYISDLLYILDKVRRFLSEFYQDGPTGGKLFKYGEQLVCVMIS